MNVSTLIKKISILDTIFLTPSILTQNTKLMKVTTPLPSSRKLLQARLKHIKLYKV